MSSGGTMNLTLNDRVAASWAVLQAVPALTAESEAEALSIQVPSGFANWISDKRRRRLMQLGLLAVTGPGHVVILSGTFEEAWALRDGLIAVLEGSGRYPDEGIRRIHGWGHRDFKGVLRIRSISEADFLKGRTKKISNAKYRYAQKAGPKFAWVDDALIFVLKKRKPKREVRAELGAER